MLRAEAINNFTTLLFSIKEKVNEDKVNLKNCIIQLNGILERYYNYQDTQLSTAQKLKANILLLEKKKCSAITSDARCNIHDIAEDTKTLIDIVICEVKALGIPKRNAAEDHSVNVNVSQTQEQNQQQDVIVNILLETIKDELTGKQWKELLGVTKETTDPEKIRKNIFHKIKDFGEDVAANIVANIVMNPKVWQSIGSLL